MARVPRRGAGFVMAGRVVRILPSGGDAMKISLSPEEIVALREGLDAYLPELERATVRSDVHSTQHALNLRWQALAALRERLDLVEADEEPVVLADDRSSYYPPS